MIDFDTLYTTYHKAIRTRIAHLVAPEHIDDLCQETWFNVARGLPRLTHEDNLYAWLYRIATNVVRDWRRHMHSWNVIPNVLSLEDLLYFDSGDYTLADEGADPNGFVVERLACRQEIQAVWDKISPLSQAALLAHLQGRPVNIHRVYNARHSAKSIRRRLQRRQERAS